MSRHDQVTLKTLLDATLVVELLSDTREAAIMELANAIDWQQYGIADDEVVAAIEEREATAPTIVAADLAIPHARVNWAGDFRVIFGRSRKGVPFGAKGESIRLVVLVVTGKHHANRHLQVLAVLAELIKDAQFRASVIAAKGPSAIRKLLDQKAVGSSRVNVRTDKLPGLSVTLTQKAVELANSLNVQAILIAVDGLSCVPWEELKDWSGKLLIVSTTAEKSELPNRKDLRVFEVPHAGLSRIDRANLGMLLAASNGLLTDSSDVICVTGPPGERLDCIAVIRPAEKFHAIFHRNSEHGTARIPPAVILRVISLAIELASEGREGKAVGTMFILGDSRQVDRRSRQLVLNPFHGFSRRMRNVLDPGLSETIKEYASLDGAFIVAADGTMLSAGTYLVPETSSKHLEGGLGARHQAAASITAKTKAMAIVISQSTGKVTVFQNGGSVLELERSSLTRW